MVIYKVINGKYKNRIGTIDNPLFGKIFNFVVFYPIDYQPPARCYIKIENLEPVHIVISDE